MRMNADFIERLVESEVALIDIDHVLHPYCNQTYGQKFFDFNVAGARTLSPMAAARSEEDLHDLSWQSFRERGMPHLAFPELFSDLDGLALYQASHQMMIEQVLPGFFEKDAGRRAFQLKGRLERLKGQGIELYAITHGSTDYAKYLLDDGYGISHVFNGIAGLDAVPNPNFKTKRDREFHEMMLVQFGLKKTPTDKMIFVDDSGSNLVSPKNHFGMVTVRPEKGAQQSFQLDKDGHLVVDDVVEFFDYWSDVKTAFANFNRIPARRRYVA